MGLFNINELIKPLIAQYNEISKMMETVVEEHKKIREFEQGAFVDEEWKLVQSLFKNADKEVKSAFEEIVNDWYSSYPPVTRGYKRRGDLKDAILVEREDTDDKIIISIVWGEESGKKMPEGQRGVGSDYMDYLAFQNGYHGGAKSGPGHPDPGTPYYRSLPNFSRWTRPAVATFSIDERMNKWIDEYNAKNQALYEKGRSEIYKKYGYNNM